MELLARLSDNLRLPVLRLLPAQIDGCLQLSVALTSGSDCQAVFVIGIVLRSVPRVSRYFEEGR